MKKSLSLFAGMVFVLAFGVVYSDEMPAGDGYTSDKMIRNEDIQKFSGETAPGAIESMPALPDELRGSAPGGMKDTESGLKSDKTDDKANSVEVEKDKTKPGYGGDTGGPEKRWDPLDY